MELKQKLQDYTQAEFGDFVSQITTVAVSEKAHNRMISHFDAIVGHPKGADLIFYPELSEYDSYLPAEGVIVSQVKQWHNNKGQAAFKDDALPQRPPKLSSQEQAWKASSANMNKLQALISKASQADEVVDRAFVSLEALLNSAESILKKEAGRASDQQTYANLEKILEQLEAADHWLITALQSHAYHKSGFEFARQDAQRSLSSPYLHKDLQVSIHRLANEAGGKYQSRLAQFKQRQHAIFPRAEAVLSRLEESLVSAATILKSGPAIAANTFIVPLEDVGSTPRILTTIPETSASFERVAIDLKKSIRSAVAGLSWLTPAADGKTIGWANIFSFEFSRRGCGLPFALTTPLSELMPIEGVDWSEMAGQRTDVPLKFRLCSGVSGVSVKVHWGLKEVTEFAYLAVVHVDQLSPSAKVSVRAAQWDRAKNAYYFDSPSSPGNRVYWSSDSLPKIESNWPPTTNRINASGYKAPVATPVVETIDNSAQLNFDDCIVVFPPSTGIDPVYVMFKAVGNTPA
ncbi:bacteriocin immunity protein [Pseudomonas syringae]|uniref:Pyosin/cloacin translocation domain-containing protein n=1 Tax=Pseudomonas syringae TaxID=317 RepID=A0A085VR59_PSESX|nr:bacteriocin immunity protein [Pseudomonas syringae]KFE57922.1 hypothetical protein IV01_00970 [Pseudomonas syringae]